MKLLSAILAVIIPVICFAQNRLINYIPKESKYYFKLGSTLIPLKTFRYGDDINNVIIHVHDDETNAVEAAKQVLELAGGLFIKIENSAQRLISFQWQGKTYTFDPNRIFTLTGIRATLKKNQSTYPPGIIKAIQKFASFLLAKIPPNTNLLIAVHNNTEGGLSINSFSKGGVYEKDAEAVNVVNEQDADNFFLTTNKILYKKLSGLNYNIVLQANKTAADDGSLSIYYGRKGKKYINVEAQLGQTEKQAEMITQILNSGSQ